METHSVSEAKIFATALQNHGFDKENGIAYSAVSLIEMNAANAAFSDLDGIIDYLLNINGANVAVLVSERGENISKISLRSKMLDVNKVAGVFGGGGHIKASGATINAPLSEALNLILSEIKKELNA
jgi:phosphoesterase RecJ-like protein